MSNYIDFRDPSEVHADLEAQAFLSAKQKMQKAVDVLNAYFSKQGWAIDFYVGGHVGIYGDFVLSSGSAVYEKNGKKYTFHVSENPYNKVLTLTVNGVAFDNVALVEEKFKEIVKEDFFLDYDFKYEVGFNNLIVNIGRTSIYTEPKNLQRFNDVFNLIAN